MLDFMEACAGHEQAEGVEVEEATVAVIRPPLAVGSMRIGDEQYAPIPERVAQLSQDPWKFLARNMEQ